MTKTKATKAIVATTARECRRNSRVILAARPVLGYAVECVRSIGGLPVPRLFREAKEEEEAADEERCNLSDVAGPSDVLEFELFGADVPGSL